MEEHCAYKKVFEAHHPQKEGGLYAKNLPHSYIIEPPDIGERYYKVGDLLTFEMVLLGETNQRLPLLLSAWKLALKRYLKPRGRAEFVDLKIEREQSYTSVMSGEKLLPPSVALTLPPPLQGEVTLQLLTPLRLQRDGKILSAEQIDLSLFLTQLARRVSWLDELYLGGRLSINYTQLKEGVMHLSSEKSLFWYEWSRYSNRQQRRFPLGGVLGEWRFVTPSPILSSLLQVGQWVHAGKNSSFGLGRFILQQR